MNGDSCAPVQQISPVGQLADPQQRLIAGDAAGGTGFGGSWCSGTRIPAGSPHPPPAPAALWNDCVQLSGWHSHRYGLCRGVVLVSSPGCVTLGQVLNSVSF